MNAKGVWGIVGDNGTQENLTIRKANLTAKGSNGSIIDIASLTLDSCIITAPEGAEYNETQHAVMLDETIVTDSVVIKPGVAILYDVVLESCTDDKAAATSLVQTVTGLGQTESEALVESVPCIILENVSLSEARKICMICTEANCTANYYPHGTWKPVGIKSVKIDTVPAHKQGIYSIDGVYLGNDFDALPKGIYIKDGKKVMK